MSIIDWEYYSSHFPSTIPQKAFNAVEAQAEIEIGNVVPKYMWDGVSEDKQKDCVFKVCNKLYFNSIHAVGQGISSINNGGYVEQYDTKTHADLQAELEETIFDSIGTRLAGGW